MIIVSILMVLFILLYVMPMKIKILYKQENKDNEVLIYMITLFGLINYKIDIPYLKIKLEGKKSGLEYQANLGEAAKEDESTDKGKLEKKFTIEEFKKTMKKSKKIYTTYNKAITYFMDKLRIEKLHLDTQYDLSNAATTGIVAGVLYSLQSNALFWILKYKQIHSLKVDINPLFKQENILHIDFSCIIHFKLGHIINGSIKSLILYKRR